MFERFDEPARRTLFFARYEATKLGARSIETEHMLLGLIRDAGGHAAAMLSALPLVDIREELEGKRTTEVVPKWVNLAFRFLRIQKPRCA
jgi:ATP-dependent Clp protease ATP-binding subunit ClpC